MGDWKDKLRTTVEETEAKQRSDTEKIEGARPVVEEFYASKVLPAFEELKTEIEKYGREVRIYPGGGAGTDYSSGVTVYYDHSSEMDYSVHVKVSPATVGAHPEITRRDGKDGRRFTVYGYFKSRDLSKITKEEIISNFMHDYLPVLEQTAKGR